MNEQIGLQVPRDRAGEYLVRMAEAIGAHAGASTVFSQPVSRNGTTVVPVAQAVWGFGGGSGRKEGENTPAESGLGGGGGALVRPVGYIVLSSDGVSYHRIYSVPGLLLAALAGGALAMLFRR